MRATIFGGCGYVGSHMLKVLIERGVAVAVYDNLSTGHRAAVDVPVTVGDLRDPAMLDRFFIEHRPDAVLHFAAKALVAESVVDPALYYDNNVSGTLQLLQAMRRHGVRKLVFSSTCASYGVPQQVPIDESHPQAPINPYGASKWMCERMIADAAAAHGLRAVSLRYFNAAGASPDAEIGESHEPETHLIPNALRAAAGRGPALKVHGKDYPTPDGTCIRDYVHVLDLAAAHLLALEYLETHAGAHAFNLGSERGHSVLQVLEAVRRVVGFDVPFEFAERRPGDPPVLVADSSRARRELGWVPRYTRIDEIVETAWRWHRNPRY